QSLGTPELAELQLTRKRYEAEDAIPDIVFNIETGIAIVYIFEALHQVEGVFVVIVDLVTRGHVQQHIGKSTLGAAGKYIVVKASEGSDLHIVGYAEIIFVVVVITV